MRYTITDQTKSLLSRYHTYYAVWYDDEKVSQFFDSPEEALDCAKQLLTQLPTRILHVAATRRLTQIEAVPRS